MIHTSFRSNDARPLAVLTYRRYRYLVVDELEFLVRQCRSRVKEGISAHLDLYEMRFVAFVFGCTTEGEAVCYADRLMVLPGSPWPP